MLSTGQLVFRYGSTYTVSVIGLVPSQVTPVAPNQAVRVASEVQWRGGWGGSEVRRAPESPRSRSERWRQARSVIKGGQTSKF